MDTPEKPVPALAHSPVQEGKEEELGLAGCEDSKVLLPQQEGLGDLSPH